MPNLTHSKGYRPSKQETSAIFEYIVTSLLRHVRVSTICKDLAVKYSLTERTINNYVKKARKYIAERPIMATEQAKKVMVSIYEEELRRCEHARDRIDVYKRLEHLYGLDDTTVNINHIKHNNVDDDKLIEIVQSDK